MSNLGLLKKIARTLRYRSLPSRVGESVAISAFEDVSNTVLPFFSEWSLDTDSLVSPERSFMERAVAKYGILDLSFKVDAMQWHDKDRGGVRVLEEFGWEQKPSEGEDSCGGPCLEDVAEELSEDNTFLKVFLEAERPEGMRLQADSPNFQLPCIFRVSDVCITNMDSIWLWHHFYL